MEPDKCGGREWVSAEKLLDANGSYIPFLVSLKYISIIRGWSTIIEEIVRPRKLNLDSMTLLKV